MKPRTLTGAHRVIADLEKKVERLESEARCNATACDVLEDELHARILQLEKAQAEARAAGIEEERAWWRATLALLSKRLGKPTDGESDR